MASFSTLTSRYGGVGVVWCDEKMITESPALKKSIQGSH
jgi:hypothetical protein